MKYIRLIRLYRRTGRAWGYTWYETTIEIMFGLFWTMMGWNKSDTDQRTGTR